MRKLADKRYALQTYFIGVRLIIWFVQGESRRRLKVGEQMAEENNRCCAMKSSGKLVSVKPVARLSESIVFEGGPLDPVPSKDERRGNRRRPIRAGVRQALINR